MCTPVPFEKHTPALRVTRSDGKVKAQVFGGVQLSPATTDIQVFKDFSDVKQLSKKKDREAAKQKIAAAAALEGPLRAMSTTSKPLHVEGLTHQDRKYQVVSMPGTDTQALGPFRLAEADVSVPLPDGRALKLLRCHNSFFDPNGPWGKGWTLDLPRLTEMAMPLHREGGKTSYSPDLPADDPPQFDPCPVFKNRAGAGSQ